MSRYVGIDFILNETDEFGYENGVLYGLSGNSAPSIDIVRCRECKYWNYEMSGCKRNPSVEAWRDDDFCSYGERAEQTEPNSSEIPNNCEDEPQTERSSDE